MEILIVSPRAVSVCDDSATSKVNSHPGDANPCRWLLISVRKGSRGRAKQKLRLSTMVRRQWLVHTSHGARKCSTRTVPILLTYLYNKCVHRDTCHCGL